MRLGLLKTREALLHVDPVRRDISIAVRDAMREPARQGEDFGEAARLRRRERGLPVEHAGKVLPFRPCRDDAEVEAERARLCELDDAIEESPGWSSAGAPTIEGDEQVAARTKDFSGSGKESAAGRARTGA